MTFTPLAKGDVIFARDSRSESLSGLQPNNSGFYCSAHIGFDLGFLTSTVSGETFDTFSTPACIVNPPSAQQQACEGVLGQRMAVTVSNQPVSITDTTIS